MKLAIRCDYGRVIFRADTRVMIDGVQSISMSNGETCVTELSPGQHDITVRCSFRKRSCTIQDAGFVNLRIGYDRTWGRMTLESHSVCSEDRLFGRY